MSNMIPKLKAEFLLPARYNDGANVEPETFFEIQEELMEKFGGVSIHPLYVEGGWLDPRTNLKYYDNSKRFEVVLPNAEESVKFLQEYKEKLKQLFEQEDIYMIYTEIVQV